MRHFIQPVAKQLGIGNISWHTFRHTYSTLLHANGEDPKVVQELLRHSSIKVTMDVYGLFWNSRVQVPFAPQLGYEMKNSGDYFFNSGGDNSTDVRFRHALDQTVKFSVFPNLSFEPTYTVFLFENKVDYHVLFQQQFSIKINYAFVWNNNRDKKQQWGYKAPSDGK